MTRYRCRAALLGVAVLAALLPACDRSTQTTATATPNFLRCPDPPAPAAANGKAGLFMGARIQVGPHAFDVPAAALILNKRIIVRPQHDDGRVGIFVELSKSFLRKVTVEISYAHCQPADVGDANQWQIWRIPDDGSAAHAIGDIEVNENTRTITGKTTRSSAFMIAN
jgi:hypothetical protein